MRSSDRQRLKSDAPRATPLRIQRPEEITEVARLSFRAIELAYSSDEADARQLAATLYFYNRIPVNRRWRERIPDEATLLRFLGIGPKGEWPGSPHIHPTRKGLNGAVGGSDPHWRFWAIHGGPSGMKREEGQFKVYVSPQSEDLPALIPQLGKYVEGSGAHALKIGRNVQALLRPDKLMVYFSDLEDAVRFGRRLLSETFLNRVHAVPFTYPIGPSGFVSIGFDPPETATWRYGKEGQSWRLWVTGRIAEAILRVRKTVPADPRDSILGELFARKIDPFLWRPLDGAWGALSAG